MSAGRRTASAKRGLLAGAAILALAWSTEAFAQGGKAPAPGAPPPDGLAKGQLYMEADQVSRDDKTKITTASGDVEVRYQGRTLRARELVYDEGQGVMRAKGDTVIINADGSFEYADEILLDDEMKAGARSTNASH